MSSRGGWKDLRKETLGNVEDRPGYQAERERIEQEIASHAASLRELRKARKFTQQRLAEALGVSQAQVSRVENQTDLYLSTLRSYIEAMGGRLELRVRFPGLGEPVEIDSAEMTEIAGRPLPETALTNEDNCTSEPIALVEKVQMLSEVMALVFGTEEIGTALATLAGSHEPGATTRRIVQVSSPHHEQPGEFARRLLDKAECDKAFAEMIKNG